MCQDTSVNPKSVGEKDEPIYCEPFGEPFIDLICSENHFVKIVLLKTADKYL